MTTTYQTLAVHGGPAALSGLPALPPWPQHGPEEEHGLLEVLRSGAWGSTHGEVVRTFEGELAAFHGAQHAIALTNGTLALAAALRALDVGVGDEVIVPPYTFIATATAALFVGAVPVFADVDPATHLLDAAAVEAAVTERTRAVIPVHLGGDVVDMTTLNEVARRHDLAVVEDCAQALGARWEGRGVGTLGDLGTFSFQTSKNITAGEGGAITAQDERLATSTYAQVNVGRLPRGAWYEHSVVGYNLRLTEFQAAVLRAQLQRLPDLQRVRAERAAALREALTPLEGVEVAAPDERVTAHGHHLFLFRVPELGSRGLRDAAARALTAEGVPGVSTGYVPLHHNEAIRSEMHRLTERLGQPAPVPDCPATDLVASDTLWLPQSVLLASEEHIAAIGQAIAKVVANPDALA